MPSSPSRLIPTALSSRFLHIPPDLTPPPPTPAPSAAPASSASTPLTPLSEPTSSSTTPPPTSPPSSPSFSPPVVSDVDSPPSPVRRALASSRPLSSSRDDSIWRVARSTLDRQRNRLQASREAAAAMQRLDTTDALAVVVTPPRILSHSRRIVCPPSTSSPSADETGTPPLSFTDHEEDDVGDGNDDDDDWVNGEWRTRGRSYAIHGEYDEGRGEASDGSDDVKLSQPPSKRARLDAEAGLVEEVGEPTGGGAVSGDLQGGDGVAEQAEAKTAGDEGPLTAAGEEEEEKEAPHGPPPLAPAAPTAAARQDGAWRAGELGEELCNGACERSPCPGCGRSRCDEHWCQLHAQLATTLCPPS